MRMLVQGDDFGITKSVTYGILDGIDNGVITATGMFTNMDIAEWVARFVKERPNFCFGIDFNLVCGKPVSNPLSIPNLVDDKGWFIRSSERVSHPKWKTKEGQSELMPYEEIRKEIYAQYNRFIELTGRKPAYINGHSIITYEMYVIMKELSQNEKIPFSFDYMQKFFTNFSLLAKNDNESANSKEFKMLNQYNKNPLQVLIDNKAELLKHENIFIGGHPGYIDADLFELSTLSIERCRDLEMMTSDWIKDFIKDNAIELIDYYDIKKLEL